MKSFKPLNKSYISIFLITFIASSLRLYTINVSAKPDEPQYFFWYGVMPWKDLLFDYISTGHKTMVVVLWRWASFIFGESEIVLRSSSWVPGILVIPLLYQFTVHIFRSKPAGLLAALLLTFSYPHLVQSQFTSGYALSAFLALLIIYSAAKLTETNNLISWGMILFLSGFSFVLTNPGNAFFLPGATFFYLIVCWQKNPGLKNYFTFYFLKRFSAFLILAVVSLSYILTILPGLKKGVLIYQRYEMSLGRNPFWSLDNFTKALSELSEPWGLGIYLLMGYGFVVLKLHKKLLPFLLLFLIPIVIYISNKVSPPSRTLFYWLPFIFILISIALVNIFARLKNILPKVFYITAITICSALVFVPVYPIFKEYYQSNMLKNDIKMAEARVARKFLETKTPKNHLVILPTVNLVLDHYLFDWIEANNVNVLKSGNLQGIIFLGSERRKKKSSREHLTIIDERDKKTKVTKPIYELFKKIPGINFYRYPGNINRFSPKVADPDFETNLFPMLSGVLNIDFLGGIDSVIGEKSVRITKKIETRILLNFTSSPTSPLELSIMKDSSFLLLTYLEKYDQSSFFSLKNLVGKTQAPKEFGTSYYLNYSRDLFSTKGSKIIGRRRFPMEWHHDNIYRIPLKRANSFWQIRLMLIPTNKGKYRIIEVLSLLSNEAYFDGIQTYLLAPS